ncbi:MAG: hypothetical protein V3R79_11010, partial [Alphaproteobacteria bacterium]
MALTVRTGDFAAAAGRGAAADEAPSRAPDNGALVTAIRGAGRMVGLSGDPWFPLPARAICTCP